MPRIRTITNQDAKHIVKLSAQLGYEPTLEEVENRIVELAALPNKNGLFLCELPDTGEVIGWIHVYGVQLLESVAYAEIGGLVVNENSRRQGCGRLLVEAAEGWASERNYATLRLRSGQQRKEEAHKFYKSIGYEEARISTLFRKTL